jgi:hypothetical protein
VVAATNVPIGYYESVISKDACGKKRLFGFRYLGFLPFSPCPVEMCGSDHLSCQNVPSDLYGMVFKQGVMTFCRLDSIEGTTDLQRDLVGTGSFLVADSPRSKLNALETAVRRSILEEEGIGSDVQAQLLGDAREVTLQVSLEMPEVDADLDQADLVKAIVIHEDVELALESLGDPVPSFNIARDRGVSERVEELPAESVP